MIIKGYAAKGPNQKLEEFTYKPEILGSEDIDIKVSYCGICHSDLCMINNEWGMTQYPIIPGHEIIGEIVAVGDMVKTLKIGDKVGLGWLSASCMTCS